MSPTLETSPIRLGQDALRPSVSQAQQRDVHRSGDTRTWKFHGWLVDGDWITTPSIELFLDTEFQMIEPVYQEWIPPQRPIPEVEPEENNLDDDPPFQEVGL